MPLLSQKEIQSSPVKPHVSPCTSSSVSTPVFIFGLLRGAAVAPVLVAVAFIMALLPMFDPRLAVLAIPGAGSRVLASHLPLSPAILAVLETSEKTCLR